jgi:hypothetical protein
MSHLRIRSLICVHVFGRAGMALTSARC